MEISQTGEGKMTVLKKRALKGEMVQRLSYLGFQISCTDTPELVFFTDKPITQKSKYIGNFKKAYMTSMGIKEAKKYLDSPVPCP